MAQQTPKSCTPGLLKFLLVLLAMALAVYIVGPPLYWQFREGLTLVRQASTCSPCVCDCTLEAGLSIPPALSNLSFADCGKLDPQFRQDMEKNYTDLLSEELRLQQTVAEENREHSVTSLLDAKRLASQYQKEAEKCNAGMETCEGARERAEASFIAEKKLSVLWEQRARQMGWKDK